MKVTILGNNSALPAYGRHPTAQILETRHQLLLIDCGEGTQMRLQQYGFSLMRIDHIFISHAHGDHYFGLVGLISSMALAGRTRNLFLFCPALIKEVISLQIPWNLSFDIVYHLIGEANNSILINTDKLTVACFPVTHSIATHGFLFTEKNRKRVLLPAQAAHFEIPKYYYGKLTEGMDYCDRNGNVIKNELVTLPGKPDKCYAYCADTAFDLSLSRFFMQADLLYHEATYLQENVDKARLRLHSTTIEAALVAKKAAVKKLIIGHFSSKYKDLLPFQQEARSVFAHTDLALEGNQFEV